MASALAGGCSPARYKAKADAEVYRIIESKWQERFGAKVNYTVSDGPSWPNDIRVDRRAAGMDPIESLRHE